MHKVNVLAFGSENLNTSLEEIKDHLSFDLTTINNVTQKKYFENFDVLLVHESCLKIPEINKLLYESNIIKVLLFHTKKINTNIFPDKLLLPATIKEINQTIENSIIKKNFTKNSSIQIKDYILDKNEKKLIKDDEFILLTEKEIQLLDLFLGNTKPINKSEILTRVWKYASDADTHTVETHIYRLRKKIEAKFFDNKFIINHKSGYSL